MWMALILPTTAPIKMAAMTAFAKSHGEEMGKLKPSKGANNCIQSLTQRPMCWGVQYITMNIEWGEFYRWVPIKNGGLIDQPTDGQSDFSPQLWSNKLKIRATIHNLGPIHLFFYRCKLKNYCNQTTCNSGICSPNYNKSFEGEVAVSSFFCDCTDTGFEGKFCHVRVSVIDRVVTACLSCFIPILLTSLFLIIYIDGSTPSNHCICPSPYLRSICLPISPSPLRPCLGASPFHP